MMRRIQRGALATSVAAALLATMGVTAAIAANDSLIDVTRDGSASLTIHKRFVAAETAANQPNFGGNTVDPLPANAADTDTLTAGFTVCKIADNANGTNYDVKTYEGLVNASKLKVSDVLGADGINAGFQDTTDQNCGRQTLTAPRTGELSLSDLKLGLYLVRETQPAEGYAATAPFLVMLPTAASASATDANAQNTRWNYDVHVYPKNSKFEVSKTLIQPAADESRHLDYHILSNIPKNTASEAITYFAVFDKLDSRVTYTANSTELKLVPIATSAEDAVGTVVNEEKLVSEDFVVDLSEWTTQSGTVALQNTVKIILTKEGLKKIQGKGNTHKLATKLSVEVDKKAVGEVTNGNPGATPTSVKYKVEPKTNNPNDPDGLPNNPENDKDPNPPVVDVPVNNPVDNRPKSTFVSIKFKKIAHENYPDAQNIDETEGLAGAVFDLHVCQVAKGDTASMTAGVPSEKLSVHKKFEVDSSAATALEDRKKYVDVNGKWADGEHATVTTKTLTLGKGESYITGVNADANLSAGAQNAATHDYVFCLVETTAPQGYDLLPYPVFVGTSAQVKAGATAELFTFGLQESVKNLKSTSFNLPNTGGAGVIAFGVIGGGLALFGLIAARRRKDEAAAAA